MSAYIYLKSSVSKVLSLGQQTRLATYASNITMNGIESTATVSGRQTARLVTKPKNVSTVYSQFAISFLCQTKPNFGIRMQNIYKYMTLFAKVCSIQTYFLSGVICHTLLLLYVFYNVASFF